MSTYRSVVKTFVGTPAQVDRKSARWINERMPHRCSPFICKTMDGILMMTTSISSGPNGLMALTIVAQIGE